MARAGCWALGLVALLVPALQPWANVPDPPAVEVRDALQRMARALRDLDYSGNFVYLHGRQLETLQITHAVRDGQEMERLVSLNGAAREVLRDAEAVTCVMPDAHAVSVDRRAPSEGLWPDLSLELDRLQAQYLLHPLGEFRVAGRDARVVGVIPKDKLRYGYRFYLDVATGLPLKTDLMSEDAQPVEQIMFTSLELDPPLPEMESDAAAHAGFHRVTRGAPQTEPLEAPRHWEFRGLPAGFQLRMHSHRHDDQGRRVDHFVLSDGLASISVYVERDGEVGLQGAANVGAVHAWGAAVSGHRVTAVGEVPEGTVRMVVESLHYRPPGAAP